MAHTYAFVIANSDEEAVRQCIGNIEAHRKNRDILQKAVDTHKAVAPAPTETEPRVIRLLITVTATGR